METTSARAKRSTHVLGTTLLSILVLLLGVGLVPGSASAAQGPAAGIQNGVQSTAQGSATALQNAVQSPTRLLGFNRTPASVRVGGQVADSVTVSPPGSRTVYVQYRRAGTTRFTNAYHEKTSRQGSFTAYLMPRSAGTWQFRLVVVAATRVKGVVSPLRTVRASGRATTTRIIGFASTPTAITVGTTVRDAVSVSPRASRIVEVQARSAGTTTWVKTSTSGRSSTAGNFTATYRPAVGVWQYRLVVRASATARTAVSATRTVTARRSAPAAPGADKTAPRPVTALGATVTDTSIKLTWTNPTDLDFTGVTIRRADGEVAPATLSAGTAVTGGVATASSYIDTGLTAGNQYSYAVFAHDAALNHATGVNVTGRTSITIAPDTTAPGPVTALRAAVTDSSIRLTWTNPTATDFTGVTIRRLVGHTPPATRNDGTAVTGGVATASSYTDTDLTAVTEYSYAVFAHDGDGNHSSGVNVTGWTNGTPPGPTAALLSIRLPFGIATDKLTVDVWFDFDATASFAGPGRTLSTATLDYGDGTSPLTFTGDSWTWVGSHRYTTTGSKDVTLDVTDSAGVHVSYEDTVTVYGAPTASIATSESAQAGEPVTFDLTNTTPSGTDITSYELDVVSADGTSEDGGDGPPPATKDITFPSPGTYRVQFSVSNDAKGSSGMHSKTIKVAGATTTAVLSASAEGVDTTSITAGGSLFFVASDSYAGPAGVTLESVELDFGDGTAVSVFNGDQASWFETHPFVAADTYQVTLRVTDSAGVTDSKVVEVTVSAAPTAEITIDGNPTTVQAGVPVTFTLTSSTPLGTAFTSWTVGGDWWDGDYGTPPPATVDHTFNTPGTYTVQFDVGNDAMGTAQSSLEVTVVP